MATFKKFEDIDSWQKARMLTKDIYILSKSGEFSKDYSFRDQIRRASVSIMANIAEGFEREGKKEFIQFLSNAKASSAEFRSHLYVALDVDYISQDSFDNLYKEAEDISKMIGGLMYYLISTDKKGNKFKYNVTGEIPGTPPKTRNTEHETRNN